ncbi:MAG: hypothetical protein JSW07_08955, partial [bacterium]
MKRGRIDSTKYRLTKIKSLLPKPVAQGWKDADEDLPKLIEANDRLVKLKEGNLFYADMINLRYIRNVKDDFLVL